MPQIDSGFRDGTHISLGISPDGFAIVLRPVIAGCNWPVFAFVTSVAELCCRGELRTARTLGYIVLTAMKAFFPAINHCATALIPAKTGKRLVIDPPDKSGNIRDSHLRVHATKADPSVVIRSFQGDIETGCAPTPLPLQLLVQLEPEEVATLVGTTLLRELIALHQDAFAPFPALLSQYCKSPRPRQNPSP